MPFRRWISGEGLSQPDARHAGWGDCLLAAIALVAVLAVLAGSASRRDGQSDPESLRELDVILLRGDKDAGVGTRNLAMQVDARDGIRLIHAQSLLVPAAAG